MKIKTDFYNFILRLLTKKYSNVVYNFFMLSYLILLYTNVNFEIQVFIRCFDKCVTKFTIFSSYVHEIFNHVVVG